MAGEGLGFQGHWQEWCGLAIASSPKGFKAEVTGGPSTFPLNDVTSYSHRFPDYCTPWCPMSTGEGH